MQEICATGGGCDGKVKRASRHARVRPATSDTFRGHWLRRLTVTATKSSACITVHLSGARTCSQQCADDSGAVTPRNKQRGAVRPRRRGCGALRRGPRRPAGRGVPDGAGDDAHAVRVAGGPAAVLHAAGRGEAGRVVEPVFVCAGRRVRSGAPREGSAIRPPLVCPAGLRSGDAKAHEEPPVIVTVV